MARRRSGFDILHESSEVSFRAFFMPWRSRFFVAFGEATQRKNVKEEKNEHKL